MLIAVKFWKLGTELQAGDYNVMLYIHLHSSWHLAVMGTNWDRHGVLNDAVLIVCRVDIIVHMTVHACSNHSIQLHLGCVGY